MKSLQEMRKRLKRNQQEVSHEPLKQKQQKSSQDIESYTPSNDIKNDAVKDQKETIRQELIIAVQNQKTLCEDQAESYLQNKLALQQAPQQNKQNTEKPIQDNNKKHISIINYQNPQHTQACEQFQVPKQIQTPKQVKIDQPLKQVAEDDLHLAAQQTSNQNQLMSKVQVETSQKNQNYEEPVKQIKNSKVQMLREKIRRKKLAEQAENSNKSIEQSSERQKSIQVQKSESNQQSPFKRSSVLEEASEQNFEKPSQNHRQVTSQQTQHYSINPSKKLRIEDQAKENTSNKQIQQDHHEIQLQNSQYNQDNLSKQIQNENQQMLQLPQKQITWQHAAIISPTIIEPTRTQQTLFYQLYQLSQYLGSDIKFSNQPKKVSIEQETTSSSKVKQFSIELKRLAKNLNISQ